MRFWRREAREIKQREAPGAGADRIRAKYHSFRELLAINNECLELMAGLQEDLQFVPPRREVDRSQRRTVTHRRFAIIKVRSSQPAKEDQ